MGGWRLEAAKMFLYLSFPIGVFGFFNSPRFYEGSLRQVMESVSKTDLDKYKKIEALKLQHEISAVDKTIQELEGSGPRSGTD